jgi:hypothetical protein
MSIRAPSAGAPGEFAIVHPDRTIVSSPVVLSSEREA